MKQQFDHSPKKQKIPGLDGLRGIAILGVIGYHLAPGIFPGGFLGVNLFFVLSGYLMAVTSRRSQAGEGFHALAFYRRRAARIYPALALCVCGTLCVAWLLTPDVLAGIRGEVISILTGTNNWWQIAQNAPYFTKITGTSPFTHLWSLAIEMQFYLIWPLLFWGYTVLERQPEAGPIGWSLLIAASVLSLFLNFQPGEDPSRVYYGSDTRCFALLIGGLIGLRHRPQRKRRESRPHLYVIAFLILLVIQLLPYFVADGERPETYWLLLFPTAWIGAALIDLCANRCFSFGRLLDVPLLSWVGKRSYELYLIQYPILFFVQRTQPLKSQAGNSILALLLILFIGNWMYGILSQMQLRFKKRRQPLDEKTSSEHRHTNIIVIDCCRDDWRNAGISYRARTKDQR